MRYASRALPLCVSPSFALMRGTVSFAHAEATADISYRLNSVPFVICRVFVVFLSTFVSC